MPSIDPRRATIFGLFAEDYELWRPAYPDEAVDWLVPPGARRVADVGAGTGKLTGLLVRRGLAESLHPLASVTVAKLPVASDGYLRA